jgi:hypothetical protein
VRTVKAAWVAYNNRANVHYTQGPSRWSGINSRKMAYKGQYPTQADCSAFVTWCIWNGILLPYYCKDTVNGSDWKAGYTGTMLGHGRRKQFRDVRKGDAIIYGQPGSTGAHTALVVGWSKRISQGGIPMVISHGSEGGPYYLPYNYRSDIMQFRRYI